MLWILSVVIAYVNPYSWCKGWVTVVLNRESMATFLESKPQKTINFNKPHLGNMAQWTLDSQPYIISLDMIGQTMNQIYVLHRKCSDILY